MKLRLVLIAGLVSLFSNFSMSQDLTNEGTDFWCAFTEMFDHTSAIFEINLSGRQPASGTVEIPGTGFSAPFTVTPGSVTNVSLPSADANIITNETILNRGIHITSDVPVTAFASTFHLYRSEATVLLPVPSLGSKYIINTYKNFTTNKSMFTIVAGTDPCEVKITVACGTEAGHLAGDSWIINLDPGEIYMVRAANGAANDLSGTIIEATNGTDKFAVFNGHRFASVGLCAGSTKDPLYEIAFPIQSFGLDHIIVKTQGQNRNAYRVVATEDNTHVYENSVLVATLNTGQYYDALFTAVALHISADKPICLNQSMVNANCSLNNAADPAMVAINPNEQMYLDTATFYAVAYNGITDNYVNIVTRTSETALVQLNSTPVAGWTVAPDAPDYSYAIVPIVPGSHTITTTGCGFLAYTYGFQWAESYFYSAGCRVNVVEDSIDFAQHIGTNENFCDVDTIQFTPYTSGGTVLSYQWDFGDGATSTLPDPLHVYNVDGTFEVTLIVEYQCKMDTIIDTVDIYSSPEISLLQTDVTCYGYDDGSVDATIVGGTPAFTYEWSNGDLTEDITDLGPGTYDVIVTDDKGCVAYDTIDVLEPDELLITVSSADPTCFGDGSGSGSVDLVTGGTGTYAYLWSTGETTAGASGLSGGDYTATVTDDNGCTANETITIVEPDPVIVPLFDDTTICVGGSISLSAIASGGTGAPFTYDWTAGGTVVPGGITYPVSATCYSVIATDGAGCVSSPQLYCIDLYDPLSVDVTTSDICPGDLAELDATPAGGHGTYAYSWSGATGVLGSTEDLSISQSATSMEYCITLSDECETPDATACVTVNIHPLPNASLDIQSGCAPLLATFDAIDDHSLVGSVVWNFGDGNSSTSVITSHEYEYDGNYNVELIITTVDGCVIDTTFTAIVEAYPVPVASFSYSPNYRPITVEDTRVDFANTSINGNAYTWDFGDASSMSHEENPIHFFPAIGDVNYTVTLIVESEYGCIDETEQVIFVEDVLLFYVPNAFTPDGDQYNDDFKPVFTEGFDPYDYHMTIFNRWGEILFESYNAAYGWDGTYKGLGLVDDGVYIWQIEFGETHTDKRNVSRGHVTILK